MKVKDGRVQKKNNWTPDRGDYYALPQSEIRIERDAPGDGRRHVVTVRQLRDFIDLLPDWDELAIGLEAIAISPLDGALGISNPGVVVISSWERDLWWEDVPDRWIEGNREVLSRLGVEIVDQGQLGWWFEIRWTEEQARAFMLLDVLVHELGHHHDRMTTSGTSAPRGEPYANAYAQRVRTEVWDAYVAQFGV